MPIYEYRCASCGHEVEALQKLSDAPLRDCPACHKAELVKRVSAAGFQLKGSGWYVTDFRNNGAKPAKKDQGKAANGDAKVAETTTADSSKAGDAATSADAPSASASTAKADAKPAAATSGDKSGD